AEDGIRYKLVTGVQTCALPISVRWDDARWDSVRRKKELRDSLRSRGAGCARWGPEQCHDAHSQTLGVREEDDVRFHAEHVAKGPRPDGLCETASLSGHAGPNRVSTNLNRRRDCCVTHAGFSGVDKR